MDILDYISQEELTTPYAKDETYNKIINDLNEFIKSVSDKDKQLLLQITTKCYFKYKDSIKANTKSDFELKTRLLMSILIDQQIQFDNLIKKLE